MSEHFERNSVNTVNLINQINMKRITSILLATLFVFTLSAQQVKSTTTTTTTTTTHPDGTTTQTTETTKTQPPQSTQPAPQPQQAQPQYNNGPKPGSIAKLEIMPFGGYMFGGRIKLYDGEIDINGNGNYGVALGFPIEKILTVELSYFRMDTKADWNPYRGVTNPPAGSYDMAMQYFQLGGIKYLTTGAVKPFGLVSLGATWFDNKSGKDWNDLWAFSAIFGGGVRVDMNDNIALRFQGRFMAPMYFDGMYLGIGTGGASGGAVFGAYALQGDFSAGLVLKIP